MRFTSEKPPPPSGLGTTLNRGESLRLVTKDGVIWIHLAQVGSRTRFVINAPDSVLIEQTTPLPSGHLAHRNRNRNRN
jgi:hypothetical protein